MRSSVISTSRNEDVDIAAIGATTGHMDEQNVSYQFTEVSDKHGHSPPVTSHDLNQKFWIEPEGCGDELGHLAVKGHPYPQTVEPIPIALIFSKIADASSRGILSCRSS